MYFKKKNIFASTIVQACQNPWAAMSKTIWGWATKF